MEFLKKWKEVAKEKIQQYRKNTEEMAQEKEKIIKEKDSLGGIAPEEIHYKDFMQNLPVSEFKVGEEMLIRGIDDLGMG